MNKTLYVCMFLVDLFSLSYSAQLQFSRTIVLCSPILLWWITLLTKIFKLSIIYNICDYTTPIYVPAYLLWEYWIDTAVWLSIACGNVSGFRSGWFFGVWCRSLTVCPLQVGRIVGNSVIMCLVCSREWKLFFFIIIICIDSNYQHILLPNYFSWIYQFYF